MAIETQEIPVQRLGRSAHSEEPIPSHPGETSRGMAMQAVWYTRVVVRTRAWDACCCLSTVASRARSISSRARSSASRFRAYQWYCSDNRLSANSLAP
jgi:hypothetical protein